MGIKQHLDKLKASVNWNVLTERHYELLEKLRAIDQQLRYQISKYPTYVKDAKAARIEAQEAVREAKALTTMISKISNDIAFLKEKWISRGNSIDNFYLCLPAVAKLQEFNILKEERGDIIINKPKEAERRYLPLNLACKNSFKKIKLLKMQYRITQKEIDYNSTILTVTAIQPEVVNPDRFIKTVEVMTAQVSIRKKEMYYNGFTTYKLEHTGKWIKVRKSYNAEPVMTVLSEAEGMAIAKLVNDYKV